MRTLPAEPIADLLRIAAERVYGDPPEAVGGTRFRESLAHTSQTPRGMRQLARLYALRYDANELNTARQFYHITHQGKGITEGMADRICTLLGRHLDEVYGK